ncbi:TetR/AcrR family transcriptional regulator [Rugosimonospora africana]|uniref:TetR family transcriptional regulator n=1 Tax=Rugosimonospora africana TaxID=556532 RepID=A0A8J3VWD7_9ACTN|nr:TetR/AcrR family transcriptional regulator [Rugosimonospora africana]GIH20653.1 TetR family transcriptional regulator [Rugosimonospora africana]
MGRPRQFDPDAAIDSAMDLFWRKGFTDTTPQDLAAELGIGKGSLYNTFASKRALFDLALRRYVDLRAAGVTATLDQPGTARERLRAALRRLADADATLTSRGCLAVNTAVELAGTDEDATRTVRQLFDRLEGAFRTVIEEGQASGEIAAGRDPGQLAALVLTSFLGMSVLAKTTDADRIRHTIDAVLATL